MAEDDSMAGSTRRRTFDEIAAECMELPYVKAQLEEADALKKAEDARKAKLPLGAWDDDLRGCPNVVLRSALFSAGKPTKTRTMHRERQLPAALGTKSIAYTGAQLYQHELDVWLELVHRCRKQPAGTNCTFNVHGFLRTLRRSVGNKDYKQLAGTFALLQATAINVAVERDENGRAKGYVGSLVEHLTYDERAMQWCVHLHPKIAELFAPSEHTWLHLDARLDLGKSYLAKWLHGYFSSHRKPYPIGVTRLRELSGSATARPRRFREALRAALTEIETVESKHHRRFQWRIDDDDLVHVIRERGN